MELIVSGELLNGQELQWRAKKLKDALVFELSSPESVIELVITDEEMRTIVSEWLAVPLRMWIANYDLVEEAKRGS